MVAYPEVLNSPVQTIALRSESNSTPCTSLTFSVSQPSPLFLFILNPMNARDRATSSSAPVPQLSLLLRIQYNFLARSKPNNSVLPKMLPKSTQSRSQEQLVTWVLSSCSAAGALRVKKGCMWISWFSCRPLGFSSAALVWRIQLCNLTLPTWISKGTARV